jgi:hypothetical protein
MSFAWITITYLDEDDYQRRVADRRRNDTAQGQQSTPNLLVTR